MIKISTECGFLHQLPWQHPDFKVIGVLKSRRSRKWFDFAKFLSSQISLCMLFTGVNNTINQNTFHNFTLYLKQANNMFADSARTFDTG